MLEVHEQYNMGLKAANDSGNLRPICEKSMNYQIVTETTDTSISISFIEVYGNASPAAAAIAYRHFDDTPRRILARKTKL
jgi:hypothetical protein